MKRKRAKVLEGRTYRHDTACGHIYIVVNHDDDGLFETFLALGKTGACGAAQLEMAGRLATACLRGNVEPEVIIKQLRGIRCPSAVWEDGVQITSCADAISRAIEEEYKYLEELKGNAHALELSEKLESSRRKAE